MRFPKYVPAAVRTHLSRLLPFLDVFIDFPNDPIPRVLDEYVKYLTKGAIAGNLKVSWMNMWPL
jgi:hypothetical protein